MIAFAVFLVLHGLIHLLGTAKASGWADLPQLTQPVSAVMGVLWLLSALLLVPPLSQRYLNVTDEKLRKGLEVSWKRRTLKVIAGGQNA